VRLTNSLTRPSCLILDTIRKSIDCAESWITHGRHLPRTEPLHQYPTVPTTRVALVACPIFCPLLPGVLYRLSRPTGSENEKENVNASVKGKENESVRENESRTAVGKENVNGSARGSESESESENAIVRGNVIRTGVTQRWT